MTQRIAMMPCGLSERFHLSHQEKGHLSGTRTSSQFCCGLPKALRHQQEVEKVIWLSEKALMILISMQFVLGWFILCSIVVHNLY